MANAAVTDLEYLGHRLDAIADAGNKGAHAHVEKVDASRALVGTYVLLGDILRIADVPSTGFQNAPAPALDAGPSQIEDAGAIGTGSPKS